MKLKENLFKKCKTITQTVNIPVMNRKMFSEGLSISAINIPTINAKVSLTNGY